MELQRRFTRDKVETYSDLILGLPGETYDIVRQGRRPADRDRPAQPHPVQQPVDPAQRRDGRSRLPEEYRHGNGRDRRSSTSMASGSSSTTTCRKSRSSSSRPRRCRSPIGAAPGVLLDDRAAALRQAVPDSADRGARHGSGPLPRHDRGLHDCRPRALPDDRRDQRLLPERGAIDPEGGPEYVFSKEYLGIYWPADEYIFVKLTASKEVRRLLRRGGRLLAETVHGADVNAGCSRGHRAQPRCSSTTVQGRRPPENACAGPARSLLEQRGGEPGVVARGADGGRDRPHEQAVDDFQKWCREIVWWGNKKGAYLYALTATVNHSGARGSLLDPTLVPSALMKQTVYFFF